LEEKDGPEEASGEDDEDDEDERKVEVDGFT
jgi:hypothetical protein